MNSISYEIIVTNANKITNKANAFMIVSFLIVLIHKTGIKKVIAISM